MEELVTFSIVGARPAVSLRLDEFRGFWAPATEIKLLD
jgi:hypothetical protein